MKKNFFVAAICSAAVFAYLLCSFISQAVLGDVKWDNLSFALGTSCVGALLTGIAVSAILAKIRKPAPNEPRYSPGPVMLWGAGVVVFAAAMGGGWMGYSRGADQRATVAAARAAAATRRAEIAAMTPEQRAAMAAQQAAQAQAAAQAASDRRAAELVAVARQQAASAAKKAESEAENARALRAGAGAAILKRAMKDPEAFTLTSLIVHASGTACYEYRAKNGFGAIFPGSAVLTTKGRMLTHENDGNTFVNVWNKECTLPDGREISELIKQLGIV